MRHVDFRGAAIDEDDLSDAEKEQYRRWAKRARAAAQRAIEVYERTGTPPREDETIWRDHKAWVLRTKFCHRCAYCEKSLEDQDVDAEHWRPKRGIFGADQAAKGHPGYFWLAYSWQNLFPVCRFCNSRGGKLNQFPVGRTHVFRYPCTLEQRARLIRPDEAIESSSEPGCWYLGPEDLDAIEAPMLLHPYFDEDPMEHLEFRLSGQVRGRTRRGEVSIGVFDLNREGLVKARRRAAIEFKTKLWNHFGLDDDLAASLASTEEMAQRSVLRALAHPAVMLIQLEVTMEELRTYLED